MKKIFVLLLAMLLVLALFAGCDMRNGKVRNSPDVTALPGSTPGHTPTITDVPGPSATHSPTADPGSSAPPTEEPPHTTPPTANTTAGYWF